jgi:hypothetical protein
VKVMINRTSRIAGPASGLANTRLARFCVVKAIPSAAGA